MRRYSRLRIGDVHSLLNQISCVVLCLKGNICLAFTIDKRPNNPRSHPTLIAARARINSAVDIEQLAQTRALIQQQRIADPRRGIDNALR